MKRALLYLCAIVVGFAIPLTLANFWTDFFEVSGSIIRTIGLIL